MECLVGGVYRTEIKPIPGLNPKKPFSSAVRLNLCPGKAASSVEIVYCVSEAYSIINQKKSIYLECDR